MRVEARLAELGLVLPEPPALPAGMRVPFARVRVRGDRAYVSGHSATRPDGSPAGPFGKVPSGGAPEEARDAARQTALAILGSLKRTLGDLDRAPAWPTVHGMVNADPGYPHTTLAINGFSDLILDRYGEEAGRHARFAVGAATLPSNNAVVIAAEVEIAP